MRVDNDLRRAISRLEPSHVIRQIALANGLIGMRASALALVRAGTIALSELPSLLTAERMASEASLPEATKA
jgi:type II secretory ATPase GspE/PulE/Tfp pilus assembly ATPase PilB-like protein